MLLPSELRYRVDKIVSNNGGIYVSNKHQMIDELMMRCQNNDNLYKAKKNVREKLAEGDCTSLLCIQYVKL